mmetsp:Transcript_20673/g.18086  ORF Transcript_20673/g.18086 Transcript_20673/m.18086 type:complete len:85 (+) Transcript_20673:819-1073(+)
MLQNQNFLKLNLLDSKQKKTSGMIAITRFRIDYKYTFLEYLRGGVRLNVIVAIDFTKSNGDPKSDKSLHAFKADGSLNDYQKAI